MKKLLYWILRDTGILFIAGEVYAYFHPIATEKDKDAELGWAIALAVALLVAAITLGGALWGLSTH